MVISSQNEQGNGEDLTVRFRVALARYSRKHPVTGALIGLLLACLYMFLCLFTTESSKQRRSTEVDKQLNELS